MTHKISVRRNVGRPNRDPFRSNTTGWSPAGEEPGFLAAQRHLAIGDLGAAAIDRQHGDVTCAPPCPMGAPTRAVLRDLAQASIIGWRTGLSTVIEGAFSSLYPVRDGSGNVIRRHLRYESVQHVPRHWLQCPRPHNGAAQLRLSSVWTRQNPRRHFRRRALATGLTIFNCGGYRRDVSSSLVPVRKPSMRPA